MGVKTGIEWTDHTFNAWIGCTKVSEGCRNCYAERQNKHRQWNGGVWGPGALRMITSGANWREPLKWAKAARAAGVREKVFCNSLSDTFDLEAPRQARKDLWMLIGDTFDALDWQLVTKRPENILPALDDDGMGYSFFEVCKCWLIASVENQPTANLRIPLLLDVPAAVYGISAEPLLGSIDLRDIEVDGGSLDVVDGLVHCEGRNEPGEGQRIDWVICGGESGPAARATHPDWIRGLRGQCTAAGVAFFFKQWGEWKPISEMPEPEHSALYVSNKKASEEWQQGNFDDIYGRRCTVPVEYMNFRGERGIDRGFRLIDGHGGMTFFRVGKKTAGARLDSVEHKAFPAVR